MRKLLNGVYSDMTEEDVATLEKAQEKPTKEALIQELATYDYIGVKIATGVATRKEYAEQIAYCEELRRDIRKLETEEYIEMEEK